MSNYSQSTFTKSNECSSNPLTLLHFSLDCFNFSSSPFHSRKSLLHEIKATKDVLMSSLKNVQDLEIESRRVPQLEARIDDLEKLLPSER